MWAYAHDVAIRELPVDKDATDTELALAQAAAVEGATDLLLLGGAGDRLDHTLGVLIALGAPVLGRLQSVRALLGETRVHVLHPGRCGRAGRGAGGHDVLGVRAARAVPRRRRARGPLAAAPAPSCDPGRRSGSAT